MPRASLPAVAALALLFTVTLAATARAQPALTITLSRTSGPGETQVAVRGAGFAAGDTVFIEIPGPSGETSRLATDTAGPDGSFVATVTIPRGGPSERITLMAFPTSFQVRSEETVNRAPKATFTVTAAAWWV